MKNKNYPQKMLIVIICQLIMAIGGAFLFCSGMGNDSFGVLMDGVAHAIGITFGMANFGISVTIIVLCGIFYRKNLSLTTIITAIIPGMVLDFYINIINGFGFSEFIVKYIYPFVGCFILGVFIACYLSLNMGASTIDNIVLWIADATNGDYRKGFIICCTVSLVVGIPLGGVWGYATFVTFFGTGNVVKFMTPFFEKTVGKWAKN